MSLSAVVKASLNATLTRALDIVSGSAVTNPTFAATFTDGAGANQVNKIWSDTRTITASGSEEIDLTGSTGSPAVTMTDVYGQTVTFARIKGIYVAASSANTNNVNVSRGSSNGCTLFLANGDGLQVRPGGVFLWCAQDATGVAVTNSSSDILTIANSSSGTSVTYDIVIIGASS